MLAVRNPPSTSAASSVLIDHKIILVYAQTLSAPIPVMISEVTNYNGIHKTRRFQNFPHMFLRPKNHAQNIFERDLDLVN